jgi:FkbM family methyltransferase
VDTEQITVDGTPFLVRTGRLNEWDVNILHGCKGSYGVEWGGVVLDVGANIGGFTCQVARSASHVYALEPCLDNYRMLCANVRLNKLGNVTLSRLAVGRDGEVVLDVGAENPGRWGEHVTGGTKEVAVSWNLRQVLGLLEGGTEVDFCKCDCEGGEYPFFIEATDNDLLKIRRAIIEVHSVPGREHHEVWDRFDSLGYLTRTEASTAASARMLSVVRKDLVTRGERRGRTFISGRKYRQRRR